MVLKKNMELKYIQPYSVINPAINSDSASVKSKGVTSKKSEVIEIK